MAIRVGCRVRARARVRVRVRVMVRASVRARVTPSSSSAQLGVQSGVQPGALMAVARSTPDCSCVPPHVDGLAPTYVKLRVPTGMRSSVVRGCFGG